MPHEAQDRHREGRYQYGRRLGTVEPVFANICSAHRLRRFSLRSKKKVNAQWLLYCMVHNIGKLQRFGDARHMKPKAIERDGETGANRADITPAQRPSPPQPGRCYACTMSVFLQTR